MRTPGIFLTCVALAVAPAACDDRPDSPTVPPAPDEIELQPATAVDFPVTPGPIEAVTLPNGETLNLWPFTGRDVIGTETDPINVIFTGQVDLLSLRAALMGLDGDRTAFGFPPVFPFNCTWADAFGGIQTAYTEAAEWTGSAVQLECGAYDPLRFHIRLLEGGEGVVLGGAHFETLIPGTTDHQVLSWELAEQLVVADFMRTGLLDATVPVMPTGTINPSPYRDIPDLIYNGLPAELRALIGGPAGNVSAPVPLATDGKATIVNVATPATVETGLFQTRFTIQFDQVIPKPFCSSGPAHFLYVNGPVDLSLFVRVTDHGLSSYQRARAVLDLVQVDPTTSPPTPVGEGYRARVMQRSHTRVTDDWTMVSDWLIQAELPPTGPFRGKLQNRLHVGPGSSAFSENRVVCGEE